MSCDPNLGQPLTYPGGVWSYEEYPAYKTNAQIVESRMKQYSIEFLMRDDPHFTRAEAVAFVNMMEQHEYFIEIEEIFESL